MTGSRPSSIRFRPRASIPHGFSFEVTSLEEVKQPLGFFRAGNALRVALCPDVTLTLTSGKTLVMELSQTAATGKTIKEATLALPEGFSVILDSNNIWRLNRLSQPICTCVGYMLRRNEKGRVTQATLRMQMTCEHMFGAGERFETVDLMGRRVNGRVEEKFTHQGEHTYLPMPFFMTEQGFGWYRRQRYPR